MKSFREVIQHDDKAIKIINSLHKLGACIMVSAWKVVRFIIQSCIMIQKIRQVGICIIIMAFYT